MKAIENHNVPTIVKVIPMLNSDVPAPVLDPFLSFFLVPKIVRITPITTNIISILLIVALFYVFITVKKLSATWSRLVVGVEKLHVQTQCLGVGSFAKFEVHNDTGIHVVIDYMKN